MKHRTAVPAMLATLVVLPASLQAQGGACDLTRYRALPGLTAASSPGGVSLTWDGDKGSALRVRFDIRQGTPTIAELAVRPRAGAWRTLASNVTPELRVVSGVRRITDQQFEPLKHLGIEITKEIVDKEKWEAFWDAPLRVGPVSMEKPRSPVEGIAGQPGLPRKPEEVNRSTATFHATSCAVKTEGARLEVSFPGVRAGVFEGRLQYTVYRGTNLVLQEVLATTQEPSVAYKYDGGLTGLTVSPNTRLYWRDIANEWQDFEFGGVKNDEAVPLKTNHRVLVAEVPGGSIAAFPPPHNFFWAREITTNLGYSWYRRDSPSSFSFGIRQAEGESDPAQAARGKADYRDNFALYSARPGTEQRMSTYFYLSPDAHRAAIDSVLAFTRNDRYAPLPGYKVMAHHFHGYFVRRLREAEGGLDARPGDFDVMRSAGVDIYAPIDGGAGGLGCCPTPDQYVDNLAAIYELARRHSDKDFVVMPTVEITPGELPTLVKQLGGHWDLLFPRPVLYAQGRAEGQPLVDEDPKRGKIYRLGSAEDVMEMMRLEKAIAYMPHPRSKGSTFYPDAIKDTERFKSEAFRGIGYRWGMGLDRSERRLCDIRCLTTLDDMNNWVADVDTPPKQIEAIGEFYQQGPGDDIYANTPVNYVRATIGEPGDWSSITEAMRKGDFFVTSGEVLIPSYSVQGTGASRKVVADVEWTFPLEFVELVWGDGQKIDRQIVSATDLPPFGKKRFEIPFDTAGKKWVRFAVWDSAGNGALVQPVKLGR